MLNWLRHGSGRSAIAAAILATSLASTGHTTIVERVVAVVGDRPMLLSELKTRTLPFRRQMAGAGSQRAAAVAELYSQMLEKMVDEELIRRAASQAKVTVTQVEIDAAMERVAKGNGVSMEELQAEIERTGVSKSQYRKELRRQLLDAKVTNMRLQGRIRVSEGEVKQLYKELKAADRKQREVQIAAIRIGGATSKDPKVKAESKREAKLVSDQAKAGSDFAELAKKHSQDGGASDGLLPPMSPAQMAEELANPVARLKPGQASSPILSGDSWVVIKLVERGPSNLPPMQKALPQLMQRIQMQKMEKARQSWLKNQRRSTHVELRL